MLLIVLASVLALAAAFPAPNGQDDVSTTWDPNCGWTRTSESGSERPDIQGPNTDVYGGWDALRGEWPWQFSMRNGEGALQHYCGGSIISQGWAMTAAHCCEGELAANIYVVAGEHDFTETDIENPNRAVYRVTDKFMHPNYGTVTLVNDTCLLKLATPVQYNDYVQPVCPPAAVDQFVGEICSTSGWGGVESGPSPAILQTVNLEVVTNEVCYQEMREFQPTWVITEDMICAGYGNYEDRDTCQGDSGGPLVRKNSAGLWELIGLTSWGYECAGSVPGVYCRVNHFLEWYDEIFAANP